MKKLRLDLEDLKVDSFQTVPTPKMADGTVMGHGVTEFACFTIDPADPCMTQPGWTCVGAECTGGGDATLICSEATCWQETCNGHTCGHYYSCQMTGAQCSCNETEGACTWGTQETCAGYDPPCPV